jgi:hypothetical protein
MTEPATPKRPAGSLRLSPEEARVAVELFGSERKAAAALGVGRNAIRYWLDPELARKRIREDRINNPEQHRRYRERRAKDPDYRKRHREMERERRCRLRDAGLCTRCGTQPLLSSSRCWDCLSKEEDQRALAI